MNKKSLIFSLILVITLSCSKEEQLVLQENNSLVEFSSHEEYNSTLQKVLEMDLDELKVYEKERGYLSFGRASEEFYRNTNMDKFKSKEEILSFVEKNNEFLQLIEDENGELELETKLYNSPDRYFLNNDKMFQIGESVYKVFESGTIVANCKDIDILREAGNDINTLLQNKSITYVSNNQSGPIWDCGTSHTWRNTNGKNRLKVEIDVKIKDPVFGGLHYSQCHFISRPYKKTLGVWFWCSRTMKADVKINWGMIFFAGCSGDLEYYHDWKNTSKYEKTVNGEGNCGSDLVFLSYDVWVDTYNVSPVSQECN